MIQVNLKKWGGPSRACLTVRCIPEVRNRKQTESGLGGPTPPSQMALSSCQHIQEMQNVLSPDNAGNVRR